MDFNDLGCIEIAIESDEDRELLFYWEPVTYPLTTRSISKQLLLMEVDNMGYRLNMNIHWNAIGEQEMHSLENKNKEKGTVIGRVDHFPENGKGKPLANADVQIPSIGYRTNTDMNGNVVIRGLIPEVYTPVIISKPGSPSIKDTVGVVGREGQVIDVGQIAIIVE